MAWDEEKSRERVNRNDFSEFDVDVQDLKRTRDFHTLGTRDVRRVEGLHIYEDVPNFHSAVADAGNDKQKQRKILREASVLHKVQGDLLKFGPVSLLQRQTPRVHALVHTPYDSNTTSGASHRAERALVHAITYNTYVHDVFDPMMRDGRAFTSAAGLASGTSYIANIGRRGDRELISLGTCANVAAKIIGGPDSITISQAIHECLPERLANHFVNSDIVAGEQTYRAYGLRWGDHVKLAESLGVKWDEEYWAVRTREYRDALPLSSIDIKGASSRIDVDSLTERNCRRAPAASLFADLDGFTQYVQEAEDDEAIVSLVRQLHMIRSEFHAVVGDDYEGLVLQHRGDCTMGMLHLPCGEANHTQRCETAVELAISLQSSMECVLNEHLSERPDLRVAVGLDVGDVLVTRVGKKGKRTVICLGPKVSNAEFLQANSEGGQTRVSKEIYMELGD